MEEMAEKWNEIPTFCSNIPPIFPEVQDLPHHPLCKNQVKLHSSKLFGSPTLTAIAASVDGRHPPPPLV